MLLIISVILGSVAVTISILSFLMTLTMINDKVKTQPNITIKTDKSNDGEKSPDYQAGWRDAVDYMLSNINITMFDLYRTNDVLDYHSHMESFQSRMNRIASNKEYQEEVVKEYNEYMKGNE